MKKYLGNYESISYSGVRSMGQAIHYSTLGLHMAVITIGIYRTNRTKFELIETKVMLVYRTMKILRPKLRRPLKSFVCKCLTRLCAFAGSGRTGRTGRTIFDSSGDLCLMNAITYKFTGRTGRKLAKTPHMHVYAYTRASCEGYRRNFVRFVRKGDNFMRNIELLSG